MTQFNHLTPEVPAEFQRWTRRPEHANRARMSPTNYCLLIMFLRAPELKLRPSNKLEADFRTQVHGYRLDIDPTSNTLWRSHDSGHMEDRKVISEDIAFNTITGVHCQHAHPGKNKTFDFVRFYDINNKRRSKTNLIFLKTFINV